MMCNPDLRLAFDDVEIISSLANLKMLDLSKILGRDSVTKCWSGSDMKVAGAFCKRMPDLKCNF